MDGLKEVYTALQERIKTPVYGSIFFALIALNWKVFFVLVFTMDTYKDKFAYFDEKTTFWSLSVCPLFLGLALVYFTPRIANITSKFVAKPKFEKKQFEMNQAYDLKEAEEARKAELEQSILDRTTESDKRISLIKDDDLKEEAKKAIQVTTKEMNVTGGEVNLTHGVTINSLRIKRLASSSELRKLLRLGLDKMSPEDMKRYMILTQEISDLTKQIDEY